MNSEQYKEEATRDEVIDFLIRNKDKKDCSLNIMTIKNDDGTLGAKIFSNGDIMQRLTLINIAIQEIIMCLIREEKENSIE